jgi:hypothetical protein
MEQDYRGRDEDLVTYQARLLDGAEARLAASQATTNFWRQKAQNYQVAVAKAQRELRELQGAVDEMVPTPGSDSKETQALLVTIHSVLGDDRSDDIIDNIIQLIEKHWRKTGQLRP